MYEIIFEHENNVNYMILKSESTGKDSYQVKMITRNSIRNLLPVHIEKVNNKEQYYYNITSKQQMTRLFEINKMKWEDLRNLCISIAGMVKSVNEYMLDLDAVLLKPEYLFVDMATKKVHFAYCPGEKQDFGQLIRSLFEYVLEHYDHETDKMELIKVYEIYQTILHNEYDPEKMEELVGGEPIKNKGVQKQDSNDDFIEQQQDQADTSIVVSAVPKEDIVDEKEEKRNTKWSLHRGVFMIGIVAVIHGILALFFPSYTIIHTSLGGSVFLLCLGILSTCFSYRHLKIAKHKTQIREVTSQQEYVIDSSMSEDNRRQNNNETLNDNHADNKGITLNNETAFYNGATLHNETTCNKSTVVEHTNDSGSVTLRMNSDNEVYSASEREANNPVGRDNISDSDNETEGHTMLLSDYLKQKQKKELQMFLVLQHEISMQPEQAEQTNQVDNYNELNHRLGIPHYPCMIGTMEGYCDIVLKNPLISRMHLCIKKCEDQYYLEDMNSTNGSFLNGIRIKPNQQLPLVAGDVIGLASVSYKVEIS